MLTTSITRLCNNHSGEVKLNSDQGLLKNNIHNICPYMLYLLKMLGVANSFKNNSLQLAYYSISKLGINHSCEVILNFDTRAAEK